MLTRGIAVIDFETTGLRPAYDRVIEVGAVIVLDGKVTESFVELMHPGRRLPWEITELTGITDAMLKGRPAPETVMPALRAFLGDRVCVAHNAGFDSRFFTAEMQRARLDHDRPFFCTLMLARRLLSDAPDHKLGTLARHLKLDKPANARAHRALDDVLITVSLWQHLTRLITERTGGHPPDFGVYQTLMKRPKAAADKYLAALAGKLNPPAASVCGESSGANPQPGRKSRGARSNIDDGR